MVFRFLLLLLLSLKFEVLAHPAFFLTLLRPFSAKIECETFTPKDSGGSSGFL